MRQFKFFKGTLDMMDGETYATASFNADTADGHVFRRRLYHTDRNLYDRLRNSNNELEQFHLDRQIQEVTRRVNGGMSNYTPPENEPHYQRLFPQVTVTQVNPTFWTKVKIFGTGVKLVLKETWRSDPIGVVVVTILLCVITFIGIVKLFGAL